MILVFITNALVILGIYHAFSKGQVFGFVRDWFFLTFNPENIIPVLKPVFICFVCMPSVWGTLGYFCFAPYAWYYFPIYVFALSGFMFLIKLYFYE